MVDASGDLPRGTVLVTGGSSGIGLAVAKTLAIEYDEVIIVGRDRDRLDSALAELSTADGIFSGLACDVRDRREVDELVRTVVDRYGEPTVLVNCAGRGGGSPTADTPDEQWIDVIDTNLHGVFWVTRATLKHSKAIHSPAGRIINIASTGGKQGVPYAAAYSASKAGVIGFTKALAKELAPVGTTVNAVCPGYVETPMAEEVRQGYARLRGSTPEQVLREFQAKIPIGRYSTPQEVAAMVHHLTGRAAGSITAQAINVCGGLGSY